MTARRPRPTAEQVIDGDAYAVLLDLRTAGLTFTLTPDEAEDLAEDLLCATYAPQWCARCTEAYATRRDGLCETCGAADDAAQASIDQITAVS